MIRKMLLAVVLLHVSVTFSSPVHTRGEVKHPEWLILGGTRGVGFALATELKSRKIPFSLFVRNARKAHKLFEDHPLITIIKGEVTKDKTAIEQAAQHVKYIVLAQSLPYNNEWEKNTRQTLHNALFAAQKSGAMLIYPGRVYKYGLTTPITEETESNPNSHQGHVLNQIETDLMEAAYHGVCKVRIIRHSYPYGCENGDGLLDKNFAGIVTNKTKGWWQSHQKFEWIGRTDIPVQFTYTHDLARFIITYSTYRPTDAFDMINFAGHTFASLNSFGKAFCEQAEEPYEPSVHSKSKLAAASILRPEARRAKDIYDFFENSILLDDSKMRRLFPSFVLTDSGSALYAVLKWYQQQNV